MEKSEERVRAITQLYYSNPAVQKAIVKFSINREVVPRYFEGFGKRPDVVSYPNDIMGAVKKGATSFHCSEEIWDNPLNIDSDMDSEGLSGMRKGWDLLIDVDSKYLDYSKIATRLIIDELEKHGIKNYGVKFSGSKGFHIIVSSNAFPKSFEGLETKNMFPEWPRAICEYIAYNIKPLYNKKVSEKGIDYKALKFRTNLSKEDVTKVVCGNCGEESEAGKMVILTCPDCGASTKRMNPRITKRGIRCTGHNCFSLMDVSNEEDCHYCKKCNLTNVDKMDFVGKNKVVMEKDARRIEESKGKFDENISDDLLGGLYLVLVASRHLFRAPYSLHEKTSLASIVLKKEDISGFIPKDADPLKIKVEKFMPDNNSSEGVKILKMAIEWKKERGEEEEKKMQKKYSNYKANYEDVKLEGVDESMFPRPIKKLLKGLEDGKKRGLFVLLTFLKSTGFKPDEINNMVRAWNKKNKPPLKEGYIRSQIDWHLKQTKKILPPNYSNNNFYKDLKLIDKVPNVKNPLVEVSRKLRKSKI